MAISRRSTRPETPLEAQKRALQKQEENVSRKLQLLERRLKEIPDELRQQELERKERLSRERAERGRRLDPPVRRSGYNATADTEPRSLRREQREAVVKLVALVGVLVGLLFWIYTLRP